MKVATISTSTPKVVMRELKSMDVVKVIHSKSIESKTKFTVQSVARDATGMVYVMTNISGETLIMKSESLSMLIGKTVDEVTVKELYATTSDIKCEIVDGKIHYPFKINEPTIRSVTAGDVFKSERREYHVEYVAQMVLCFVGLTLAKTRVNLPEW